MLWTEGIMSKPITHTFLPCERGQHGSCSFAYRLSRWTCACDCDCHHEAGVHLAAVWFEDGVPVPSWTSDQEQHYPGVYEPSPEINISSGAPIRIGEGKYEVEEQAAVMGTPDGNKEITHITIRDRKTGESRAEVLLDLPKEAIDYHREKCAKRDRKNPSEVDVKFREWPPASKKVQ